MLLTPFTKKILMGIVVSSLILIAFYALNEDKNHILQNPISNDRIKHYENMTFNISGFSLNHNGNIELTNFTFKGYKNESAIGMYDYTHNRNMDKMSLWKFLAELITFCSFIYCIYLYFSKRKHQIDEILTFNLIITTILFLMYCINFDKFYYDVYGQHTTDMMKIITNTIGVLL
jgi:hypothetical protein